MLGREMQSYVALIIKSIWMKTSNEFLYQRQVIIMIRIYLKPHSPGINQYSSKQATR